MQTEGTKGQEKLCSHKIFIDLIVFVMTKEQSRVDRFLKKRMLKGIHNPFIAREFCEEEVTYLNLYQKKEIAVIKAKLATVLLEG